MTDLRAIAENCLAYVEGDSDVWDGYHVDDVARLMEPLCRAVLSSLDIPADVQAAMRRLREVYESGHDCAENRALVAVYSRKIADYFLARQLRIDTTDREQLLRDVEIVRYAKAVEPNDHGPRISWEAWESAQRLAAHTRRTLLGEK